MQLDVAVTSVVSLATQLAALHEEHHQAELHAGEAEVHVETLERACQREEQRAAEERAREEAESSSFWGDVVSVAKDVAAAGAIAGAAFSGGSSLLVLGAVAGGSLTIGGDVMRRAGVDGDVCTAVELVGAATTLTTGGASILLATSAGQEGGIPVVALVGRLVGAGGTVVEGGAVYEQKTAQGNEASATADATEAGGRAATAGDGVDDAISRMGQSIQDAKLAWRVEAALEQSEAGTFTSFANTMRG